jgi:dGTPase
MGYARRDLERIENEILAPYGFRSANSRGREFPEEEPHYRTCFQRDRDRILHTTAFRRLEYKTQVFVTGEGDYYRTRLTHTLEVSQIGRTIARALGGNEDLEEAICLAHDLGHAAFGHAGETTLSGLMRNHGGFDHNRQSLRIVTELENRYPDFPGLNLTWELREGIVKHETEYDISEAAGYEPEKRGHLEAQIANVADELAYTAHDLDDGLRQGFLTPSQLEGVGLWEMLRDSIDWHGHELEDLTRHRLIRRLIGIEVRDIIETSQEALIRARVDSVEGLQSLSENVVHFSSRLSKMNTEVKSFLFNNVYQHYRVLRMQTKAERILKDLFHGYVDTPMILPLEVQERATSTGLERTVCDYIAGMTDRFALLEHARLFDPKTRT